jgi:hypothetical protein
MGVYHTSATALEVLADVKGTQFPCFTSTTVKILTEELVKAMEELVDSLQQVGGAEKDKLGGAERMEDVLKLRRTLVASYKEWLQSHSFYDMCLCRYFLMF